MEPQKSMFERQKENALKSAREHHAETGGIYKAILPIPERGFGEFTYDSEADSLIMTRESPDVSDLI